MLTHRFDEALRQAADLHRHEERKGTRIPYLAHLLSVAGIALTHGATEDEAIAALLHDAIEDVQHPKEEIARDFGPAVADIAAAPPPAPPPSPTAEAWPVFEPPGAGFRVRMPGTPQVTGQTATLGPLQVSWRDPGPDAQRFLDSFDLAASRWGRRV